MKQFIVYFIVSMTCFLIGLLTVLSAKYIRSNTYFPPPTLYILTILVVTLFVLDLELALLRYLSGINNLRRRNLYVLMTVLLSVIIGMTVAYSIVGFDFFFNPWGVLVH